MTIATAPPSAPTSAPGWRGLPAALLLAVAAGTLLGVADLAWNASDPSAWSAAANSCGVWATAAYVLGAVCAALLRTGPLTGGLAGVAMLVVAVEAYYVAGIRWLGDDPSVLSSPSTQAWLQLSVVVGGALGAAGAWSVRGSWLPASLATAVGAAMLLGDALLVFVVRPAGAVPGIEVCLGLLGVLVLAAAVRRPTVAVTAALAGVPLTVLVAAAFTAAGVAV
jgi:hypothetical protein